MKCTTHYEVTCSHLHTVLLTSVAMKSSIFRAAPNTQTCESEFEYSKCLTSCTTFSTKAQSAHHSALAVFLHQRMCNSHCNWATNDIVNVLWFDADSDQFHLLAVCSLHLRKKYLRSSLYNRRGDNSRKMAINNISCALITTAKMKKVKFHNVFL